MKIYSAFNSKPIDEMTHYELLLEMDFYLATKDNFHAGSPAAKHNQKCLDAVMVLIKEHQLTDLLTGTDSSGVVPYEQNQSHQSNRRRGKYIL